MAEPIKRLSSGRIVISPDNPALRRTWPDPWALEDVCWRAVYSPDALTREDVLLLVSVAGAYSSVFEQSQRGFLPTHAAIRSVLSNG